MLILRRCKLKKYCNPMSMIDLGCMIQLRSCHWLLLVAIFDLSVYISI